MTALLWSSLALLYCTAGAALTSNTTRKDSWKKFPFTNSTTKAAQLWSWGSQQPRSTKRANCKCKSAWTSASFKNKLAHLFFFTSLTWYRDRVWPYSLLLIVGQPVKERFESLNAVHSSRSHTLWIHPNRAPSVISRANPFATATDFEGEQSQKGIYHFNPAKGGVERRRYHFN